MLFGLARRCSTGSVWIHWRAERSDRPVLFSTLTLMNLALG
jgi:hypothetical protein